MRQIALGNGEIKSSALGFGCAALLGRAGRKDSLRALGAAFDAGITFYDTARSYGYGQSEGLLGEFLQGRRDRVVISTKFGILPAETNFLKETLKPLARKLLEIAPGVRKAVHKQIGAQFSANHFSVAAMRESLENSLKKLRTDYVDFLFMHSAPATVLEQGDLFEELQKTVDAGKVRRFGISAEPEVIQEALEAGIPGFESFQFPCNVFGLGISQSFAARDRKFVAVANHPFGGVRRVAESKAKLAEFAADRGAPQELREKLNVVDDLVLADVVLNVISRGTGIDVVIPSMMQVKHLHTNVAAIEKSRFTSQELAWMRDALTTLA